MTNNTLVTQSSSNPDKQRLYIYYAIIQGDAYG